MIPGFIRWFHITIHIQVSSAETAVTVTTSLRLLDMTRNAPHFLTFSLGALSASYGLVGLREILHGTTIATTAS